MQFQVCAWTVGGLTIQTPAAGSTPLHFVVDVDRPESAQILLILVLDSGIPLGSGFMQIPALVYCTRSQLLADIPVDSLPLNPSYHFLKR